MLEANQPIDQARRLVFGYRAFQLVVAACELEIPDLLAAGPKSAEELAAATQTHAPSLRAMLRGLAAWDVVVDQGNGMFAATPVSDCFRSDLPGLRNLILMHAGDGNAAWSNVLHTMRTGGSAFVDMFGMRTWEKLAQDPVATARFNAAMAENSRRTASAIVAAYDFTGIHSVVDVGGGSGALLAAVLRASPDVRGALFDLAQGLASARETLEVAGVLPRVTLVEGDFFESVPAGSDLYLLKWIIHDWSDEEALVILGNCRKSMSRTARLVVVERNLPYQVDDSPAGLDATMADLHMRVVLGGRERTSDEYRDLFARAGLRMTRVIPTQSELAIYEVVRGED
jgi:hypothetical protein